MDEYFLNLCVGKGFLIMTQNLESLRENIDTLYYVKMKKINMQTHHKQTHTYTQKGLKIWEKIFVTYVKDKVLISLI